MADIDERRPVTTADESDHDRFSERVGGRSRDAGDARPGSAVLDMKGERVGTVTSAEGKYIGVESEDGDQFWLSVSTIERVIEGNVQLNFDKSAIEELALTDEEQVAAGLEAPSPIVEESLNQLSSEEEKVSRREGLVRDE